MHVISGSYGSTVDAVVSIDIPGTTYKIVTNATGPAELECLVFDSHFVIRLGAWFFGPTKVGPPRRLPEQEQIVLTWFADMLAKRNLPFGKSLEYDPWLPCIESSRRAGEFDPVSFDRRFEAVEVIFGEWASNPATMRRNVSRARGSIRAPAVPMSLMEHDGEQLHTRIILAMIDVLELHSAITAARVCRSDAARISVLDQYLHHLRSSAATPPSSAIPVALDGIFSPLNTSLAVDALFKPAHTGWSSAHGVVKIASNVVFDMMMIDRVRDGNLGLRDEDFPPAVTGLLTQDKAMNFLLGMLETVAVTPLGTLDALDLSILMPRSSPDVRATAARLLEEHSASRVRVVRQPTIEELEATLLDRLAAQGMRTSTPVSGLFALAEQTDAFAE